MIVYCDIYALAIPHSAWNVNRFLTFVRLMGRWLGRCCGICKALYAWVLLVSMALTMGAVPVLLRVAQEIAPTGEYKRPCGGRLDGLSKHFRWCGL